MTDEFANLGLLESPPDDRDWPLQGAIADNPAPTDARYRSGIWPNANQFADDATKSACVAYSGCNTRIITEQLVDGQDQRFDQLELYRRAKERDGVPTQPGTYIRVVADILRQRGAAVGTVDTSEGAGGRVIATTPPRYMPISGYVRVDQTLRSEIKKSIYYLGHCWAAVRWYRNWNPSANPPAVLPKPGTYTTGHAIVFIGWDDELTTWAGKGALRFKNSFGRAYGDEGDAWLPYQVLATVLREAWATFDLPDVPPEPTEPEDPSSGSQETPMPQLTEYLPGYTAIVDDDAYVRETPTLAGKVIRHTTATEAWVIVGAVKGDVASGSDRWYARFANGRWEYTHSVNVPTAPQAPPDTAAIQAGLDAAETLASGRAEVIQQIKTLTETAP